MLTYEEFKEELVTMLPTFLPDDLKTRGISVEPIVATNDQHRDILTPAGAARARAISLERPVNLEIFTPGAGLTS